MKQQHALLYRIRLDERLWIINNDTIFPDNQTKILNLTQIYNNIYDTGGFYSPELFR